MPRYFIWTIGCQMNKAESQQIAGYLDSAGYQATTSFSHADLVVLNTCVVRQSAENKVSGTLGLLKGLKSKRPSLQILVTGCFVNSHTQELQRRFPHVDLLFKPGDYPELIAWAQQQGMPIEQRLPRYARNDGWTAPSPCALIPIIQGCDNFCSYCIVPYRRGREVSRPVKEIVCEVAELVRRGMKEVTLLGQNVDSYGHDLPEHPDLADLLKELSNIDDLVRIRFLTNHPKDMSLKLIETMASVSKVCEHLELPVQSGDNDILKAMRRGYTVERYRDLVHTIRHKIPHISLSTDMIVGFPAETEEQFEHSLSLVQEMRFDVVHVAAYSPRRGTVAWREYQDDIPGEIKKERLNEIEELQTAVASETNSQLQGKEIEVLVEGKKGGKWFGRTRSNKLVFFEDAGDWLGQLAIVHIQKTSPWSLIGQVKK
ncbi:MAG: tRNA (N6-isopentenyl adenosine(37)-C2)-methylthiotransferase MiaB [Dehalococcoidia bacterium]|nr:tRNA (N6-isopentenyl adenosine(37)-C2)-methylthiotransferase MiaB [Dehalococcoidia bacterium]MDH4290992.1 tRNA (N6-isopentenyl adenosine(37)-C2)-methylthiotransferase MiaB [Dehalococcoidia bacterium]